MAITWTFGLRRELSPDDHRRVLHALWELSPKDEEAGNCVRDVVTVGGTPRLFECSGGHYQPTPESISLPILEAIERAGRCASWSNELAADFHEGAGEIFVPFLIATSGGYVDALRVELPLLGTRVIQYSRVQSRWLAIDEESELLDLHRLSRHDVFAMNARAHALEDLAMEHALLMSYG